MSLTHIQQLLLAGESETLDFKQTISSAAKIAKTMSAFANHKGGTLLVGVTDKKMICGIQSEDEKYMLDMAARFYCKPEIAIEIKEWEIGNKVVLEAFIPEGEHKPYYAKDDTGKWWAHIRVKDQSLLASKVVVDVLKRQHSLRGTVIQYTDKEKDLLKFIETKGKVTLKEVCKLLNISRWRAQKMLVNLVSVGVIRSHTTEKTEFFTLS
ncbi:MAG: ATP-binding protein [Bacteroidia bacterium]|nr:ATP-binding protein [Bacteroidia bacterium]